MDERDRLAVATAHPRWIVDAFADVLPDAGAGGRRCAPTTTHAPVTLAVRPGLAEVGELTAAGAEPGRYSPYAARWSGNPADLPAVREGRAGVQDEGSQLVAAALARVEAPVGPWLDLCAGPGGKTALLAGLAGAGRARAWPPRSRRTGRRSSGRRCGPTRRRRPCWWPTGPVRRGGRAPSPGCWSTPRAPGLGALRRRPESRWRRRPDDVEPLHRLQLALLAAAIDSTAPGGVVGYVTCSPHRHETVDVVEATLWRRATTSRWSRRAACCRRRSTDGTTGDYVQLWPHRHGTDAMFAAYLRRRG